MAHSPHDQFAKQFLEELLSPLGQVELNREVLGEARWVDLWFRPNPQANAGDRARPSDPSNVDLGLLGTFTQIPCLLEPYRNPPSFRDIRSCLSKRLALVADQERKTPTLRETDLPHLWILVPTCSDAARQHCDAYPDPALVPGCYRLSPLLGTHLIVLHQLPPTPDTLWLRLLGKGQCQRQAIREVLALPQAVPFRNRALQLLANWKIALETLNPPPSEEEETLMALSQAYLEWEQKTIRLGEERGIRLGEERGIRLGEAQGEQRERRRLVLEMLEMEMEFKFGDRGRSLLPYLQAVDNTSLLYDFLRSLKPLATWDEVQSWWFDRLGPREIQTVSDDAEVAVAVKLRFPDAAAATIAQVAAQLGAEGLDWSALRPRLEAAPAIGAIAGDGNTEE